MHRHVCIEAYNAPITSTAVEITIIISISVLLYAYVVIIDIHVCLCSALLLWPQKHPQNRSFCEIKDFHSTPWACQLRCGA